LTEIRHFYHLFLDGDARWQDIANEYAEVLQASGFPVVPVVGLIGADRDEARQWVAGRGWTLGAEADAGYEQVTLIALQRALAGMADDTAVLYTHGKGAWRNMPLEDQWRRSMLWHLVFGWQDCVKLLDAHEVVGCHWRRGDHFAGNFWWARAGFLRGLPVLAPAVAESERYAAELWLGEGHPSRVANLVEGFPPEGTEEGARLASEQLSLRWVRRRAIWPRQEG